MLAQLGPAFEWGRAQARRDVLTWLVLAVLSAGCAASGTLTLVMLPGWAGTSSQFVEESVPAGAWLTEWTPAMQPPAAEQQRQVRALRWVTAATSGLLAVLCALVVAALWGQRLRLRRDEHFVHWAVGANRWQLAARLLGEARFWGAAAALGSIVGVVAMDAVLEGTFPGHAAVPANGRAAVIVLTGLAAGLARWERRAASGPVRTTQVLAYELLGSTTVVATVGVSVLAGVGLLVMHPPTGASPLEPRGVVVRASLAALPEDSRRQQLLTLTEALSAPGESVGLASAGAARGVGHHDAVSTECGRCSEGRVPMPIKSVRAEVHAVAQDTFAHLGIAVTRGRDFDSRGDVGSPLVAIVSQALANRHFERGEAVGRRVRVGYGDWFRVVGVVQDATDARVQSEYAVYLPVAQAGPSEIEVFAEGAATTARVVEALAAAGARVTGSGSRTEVFEVFRWFRAVLGALGMVAMALLAAGLWVAAASEMRATQFEAGLRRAVGARRRDLYRFYMAFLARRLAVAVVAGAWLSLFLGAGLAHAHGEIPQVDGFVLASAGAWVTIAYLAGSLTPLVRVFRAPLLDSLNAAS